MSSVSLVSGCVLVFPPPDQASPTHAACTQGRVGEDKQQALHVPEMHRAGLGEENKVRSSDTGSESTFTSVGVMIMHSEVTCAASFMLSAAPQPDNK